MNNEKISFVGYCDWLNSVELLEDVEAGQLFKHLLRYVNKLNPTTDDKLIKIAFEPMKLTLKRDLKKYETYILKQKANGKKGGRPKAKETEKTQPFISEPKKADSVSVSVSVSDSVKKERSTDVDIKTDSARDYNSLDRDSYYPVTLLAELFFSTEKLINSAATTTGRSVEQLKNYLPEFVLHLQAEGRGTEKPSEFARYFRNKVKLDSTFQRKHKTNNNTGEYQWIFKGTTRQKGDRAAYENAKMNFDKAGFGFKTLKAPAHAQ